MGVKRACELLTFSPFVPNIQGTIQGKRVEKPAWQGAVAYTPPADKLGKSMQSNTNRNTDLSPGPAVPEQALERWYAIRVRSKFELVSSASLSNKGYDTYLPLYTAKRHSARGVRISRLPLFPGYVFCRMDATRRLPVLMTPGVVSIVSMGAVPAPIDDRELEAVRTILHSGLEAGPFPFLSIGQSVLVVKGPLAGLQGLVVRFGRQQRLVVSVTLLQRSIAVEVDRDSIEALPMRLGPKTAVASQSCSILSGAA